MRTDCPPTDETIEMMLQYAKELSTQLPREAVTDVCPVCATPVIVRNCEVICESDVCKHLLIESCSGG
jgi:RNase P subunit RPR2